MLSHDATFLKQIWEKCSSAERTALTLSGHGRSGSKISAFNLEKACQGRTANDVDDLQAFVMTGAGKHVDLIRKMRTGDISVDNLPTLFP